MPTRTLARPDGVNKTCAHGLGTCVPSQPTGRQPHRRDELERASHTNRMRAFLGYRSIVDHQHGIAALGVLACLRPPAAGHQPRLWPPPDGVGASFFRTRTRPATACPVLAGGFGFAAVSGGCPDAVVTLAAAAQVASSGSHM